MQTMASDARPDGRLVVVSNRLPAELAAADGGRRRPPPAGGLVSALSPVLEEIPGAVWVGWSGAAVPRGRRHRIRRPPGERIALVGIDLDAEDVDRHYHGFCNGALWPLLHCFPGRMVPDRLQYEAYQRVNEVFARVLSRMLRPRDRVWVHDYHLFPLGRALRERGFRGPCAFFLHIPFPPHEIISLLPWAGELLADLLDYDVVGFHTEEYAENYVQAVARELRHDALAAQRVGVYPIGIDPATYRSWAEAPAGGRQAKRLRQALRGRKIVLGVDRLDYTKGIVERLRIFERFLEMFPRWRRKVSFVQISAPSRTSVPEYARQRSEVEGLVGRINGRFGDTAWVPVRYLFRSYGPRNLAAFYREADVCFVSPLRDGMNLVAKEFVACQAADPGVLVLSRFAGAARDLREAVLVNPYDTEGTARALDQALSMPLGERAARQEALLRRVEERTAARWARSFLDDLGREEPVGTGDERESRLVPGRDLLRDPRPRLQGLRG